MWLIKFYVKAYIFLTHEPLSGHLSLLPLAGEGPPVPPSFGPSNIHQPPDRLPTVKESSDGAHQSPEGGDQASHSASIIASIM
jgi:hypothetical protein